MAINYHTDKEGAEKTAEGVKKAGRKAFISQGDVGSESYVKVIGREKNRERGGREGERGDRKRRGKFMLLGVD